MKNVKTLLTRILLACLMVAVVFTIAACNGDNTDDPQGTQGGTGTESNVEEPSDSESEEGSEEIVVPEETKDIPYVDDNNDDVVDDIF